jgi:hypothetical protein
LTSYVRRTRYRRARRAYAYRLAAARRLAATGPTVAWTRATTLAARAATRLTVAARAVSPYGPNGFFTR